MSAEQRLGAAHTNTAGSRPRTSLRCQSACRGQVLDAFFHAWLEVPKRPALS
jgi:hypothetical protein